MISTQKQRDSLKLNLYIDMLAYYKNMCKHEDIGTWVRNVHDMQRKGKFGETGKELIWISIALVKTIDQLRSVIDANNLAELQAESIKYLNSPPHLINGISGYSFDEDCSFDWAWCDRSKPVYECIDRTTTGKNESFKAYYRGWTIYN